MKTPPKIIADLLAVLKATETTNLFSPDPDCAPTGSRVICTPPVLNTDDDWLVYVPEELQDAAIQFLESQGATHSQEQETYPDGVCYRLGEVNPILIWDYAIYYRWVMATYWASKLNLQKKEDRTKFFQTLVDESLTLTDFIL